MKVREIFVRKMKPLMTVLIVSFIISLVLGHKKVRHLDPVTIDTNLILPPAWAFGVLYGGYTNQEQTMNRVSEIVECDYPIDAYWIDSWFWDYANKGMGPMKYIDFVADTIDYPNRKVMWDYLATLGIKGGFWCWDCIFETGQKEVFDDFSQRGFFRDTYIENSPWHNYNKSTSMHIMGKNKGTLCGNIDFESKEAVAYFKSRMKPFFDEGADFIKLDRTSDISVCRTMFEISQELGLETKGRGFILSHTGGMESDEYKRYPAKWTGDTRSDWTSENQLIYFPSWIPNISLKENIAMFTDSSNQCSQIPFLTNDLGGFDMGQTDSVSIELYIRWMQFSMFNPIVEVFSQPENPTSNLAYKYKNPLAHELFKKYSHARMKLFPYIYSSAHNMRLTGEHMIGKIKNQLYEMMFGKDIFIAPVFEKGATTRTFLLPDGVWVNYFTKDILIGGKEYTVDAPIEQIPIMIRQGAIIPTRQYARSILKGSNDTLTLHVYAGADGVFTLIEDDGLSNDYIDGIYAKTELKMQSNANDVTLVIDPILGNYEGMLKDRTWILDIVTPSQVTKVLINGKNLNYAKYDYGVITQPITLSKFRSSKFKIMMQ